MNKRLGKWQIIIGSLIAFIGIIMLPIQPFVAIFVVFYGGYVVFVGFRIKKGNHQPFKKDEDQM